MKKSVVFTIIFVALIAIVIAIPLLLNKKPEQGQAVEQRLEDVDVITEFTQDMVGKIYKSGTKIEDYSKNIIYTERFDCCKKAYVLRAKEDNSSPPVYYEDEEYLQSRIQMKEVSSDEEEYYLGQYDCYYDPSGNYNNIHCFQTTEKYEDQEKIYVGYKIDSINETDVVVSDVFINGKFSNPGFAQKGQFFDVRFSGFDACSKIHFQFKNARGQILGDNWYGWDSQALLGIDYDVEYWNVNCPYFCADYLEEKDYCFCVFTESSVDEGHSITVINDDSKGNVRVIPINDFDRLTNPKVNVQGDSIKFSVFPNDGYKAVIVVTDADGNNILYNQYSMNYYKFIMPNKDVTITVTYELITYSVDIITPDETKDWNINLDNLTSVAPGESVVYSAEPIQGYELVGVDIVNNRNNQKITPTVNNGEYSFTMPRANVTITPVFEKIKNAIIVEDNTSTEDYDINVDNMTAVEYDKSVVISFTPEEGYELVGLTIVDEDNQAVAFQETGNPNEYEFVMPDKDVTITPTYQLIQSGSSSDNPTPDDPTLDDPTLDDSTPDEPSSEDSNNQSTEFGETPPNTNEVKTSVLGTIASSLLLLFFVYAFIFFRKKYFRRKKYR